MPNMKLINRPKTSTFDTAGMLLINPSTTICSPLILLTALSGRKTRTRRNVLRMVSESSPARPGRDVITMNMSRQFQPDLTYAPSCSAKPCAPIFNSISTRNAMVKTTSAARSIAYKLPSSSRLGSSSAKKTELTAIRNIMNASNLLEDVTAISDSLSGCCGGRQYRARCNVYAGGFSFSSSSSTASSVSNAAAPTMLSDAKRFLVLSESLSTGMSCVVPEASDPMLRTDNSSPCSAPSNSPPSPVSPSLLGVLALKDTNLRARLPPSFVWSGVAGSSSSSATDANMFSSASAAELAD
mmetsp:Transcript_16678/g.56883  ORF Transcript_16678/g.56883 Transcript_16678/m.56883 type:complete len:298 (-) Transcript_16678:2326-3219(-)